MPVLRVLTYDMHAGRAAAAQVLREAQPDVACVRNAPHLLRWRSKCAALARTSGLVVVGGGRPTGANLVMSTLSVDVDAVHDFRAGAIALLRLRGTPFAFVGTRAMTHELQDAIKRLVPEGVPVITAADSRDGTAVAEVELPG